ncbi:MAG TPA: GNAT family N-acetyltransferase [Acidobacteriota bacterium]|jgi:predicted N-acetyltransferase YhbS
MNFEDLTPPKLPEPINMDVKIQIMTDRDIPVGDRLREAAGWNQTESDWRRFLTLEPKGCFVACVDGQICGTVTTLNYENRVAWIGMVLVDPAYQRRGIGKTLLDAGIEYLERKQVETIKLDATPMGHDLYLQRGFVDEYMIERWEGAAASQSEQPADAGPDSDFGPMESADVTRIFETDRNVFGADRSALLHSIWKDGPAFSAAAFAGGGVSGYILGRSGARAVYLGPWVAHNRSVAEKLFACFLRRASGAKIFVDVCLENPHARSIVESVGFQFQRPLTRMYRGSNRYPGKPQFVCGIAGPELG